MPRLSTALAAMAMAAAAGHGQADRLGDEHHRALGDYMRIDRQGAHGRDAAAHGIARAHGASAVVERCLHQPMRKLHRGGPGGGVHDGLWYASDVGGAIKGERIDLFTGPGAASMRPLLALNMHALTVTPVKRFEGCPPI